MQWLQRCCAVLLADVRGLLGFLRVGPVVAGVNAVWYFCFEGVHEGAGVNAVWLSCFAGVQEGAYVNVVWHSCFAGLHEGAGVRGPLRPLHAGPEGTRALCGDP